VSCWYPGSVMPFRTRAFFGSRSSPLWWCYGASIHSIIVTMRDLCRCCRVQCPHAFTDAGRRAYSLRVDSPEFESLVRSVLAEAALLRSLSHPNVLQLIGVVMNPETNSVRWMLTELANGGSLQHWLARQRASGGGISLRTLLFLMVYVMRGLAYLHALTPQVLHRDLKAANVLVFVGLDGGVIRSPFPAPISYTACACHALMFLCCAVLCCAVLCCAVLCCAVLCCAVLCCAVLVSYAL
jgi:hypothetical protein